MELIVNNNLFNVKCVITSKDIQNGMMDKKFDKSLTKKNKEFLGQNGFGAVGNYDNRVPWFESHRQQNFLFICQLDKRDEEKEKRSQKWPKFFIFYEIIHFSFDPCCKKVKAKIRTKENEEMGMGNFVSMDNKF